MNMFMRNRAFRTGCKAVLGILLAAGFLWAVYAGGKLEEFAYLWCAFLFCMLVCAVMWACLMLSRPHPDLGKQKEMATALTVSLLAISASAALAIPWMMESDSPARVPFGLVMLIAFVALVRWTLGKVELAYFLQER